MYTELEIPSRDGGELRCEKTMISRVLMFEHYFTVGKQDLDVESWRAHACMVTNTVQKRNRYFISRSGLIVACQIIEVLANFTHTKTKWIVGFISWLFGALCVFTCVYSDSQRASLHSALHQARHRLGAVSSIRSQPLLPVSWVDVCFLAYVYIRLHTYHVFML